MSKFTAVLLATLLIHSAWSEATSRVRNRPTPTTSTVTADRPSVVFQDQLLGSVKMRPVYTPRLKFGGPQPNPADPRFATVQRPAVSVAQITAVRPGSWR
ncbi:hypothetical protein JST97_19720 [bacterium]|nr:hypothetical protein [bacterium]